jgi:hypothetical protein
MKTHTELLTELIAALYAAPITVETHPLKVLAAEIKGQMMAQLPPMMTLDTETSELVEKLIYGDIEIASLETLGNDCPTHEEFQKLDDEQKTRLAAAATVKHFLTNQTATTSQLGLDGWIENTGVMPSCIKIKGLKFKNGRVRENLQESESNTSDWSWHLLNHITHYKPA